MSIEDLVEEEGLMLDDGCRVGGPFIPDGTCRIYGPEDHAVLASGETPEEAWDDYVYTHLLRAL